MERATFDWNDLQYFLAAAREKTLSGAARSLGVKHSTVGRRISALERSIAASLFVRKSDGLALTELGGSMLSRAEEVERAVLSLLASAVAKKRRVRLACPSGFVNFLGDQLTRFHRTFPDIELELLSGSHQLDLKKGEAELAVRLGPIADEDLIARKVGDMDWSLYASRAYLLRHSPPTDPRDLAGHEILGYDTNLAGVPGAKWIEQYGQNATIVLRSHELTDTLTAARHGLGLALMPCMLAETELTLRRLTPEVIGRHAISVIYRKEMRLVEPVRTVIDFIVDVMHGKAKFSGGTT